ncbi:MAG: Mor transcription activator family protein [Pseudohongiellaceae bacterium]|nr:Mor transcription activator family protein [Pseudohongiellaceae bacterium]
MLLELQEIALRVLANSGVADDVAHDAACQIVSDTRTSWGGQQVYFRKADASQMSERNAEIYSKFRGDNHYALAKEYGLTTSVIYRIVKTMRAEEREKRQHKLFEDI